MNTWHGTPLKTLGKGIKNAMHGIGNAQKNFVCADYLLYPNRYTMEHMVEDYMLEDMAKGECVLAGYPRNTAFFNKNRGAEIIEEMGLQGKRVYAYMPTWRGSVGNIDDKANTYFKYYLYELDKLLDDDTLPKLKIGYIPQEIKFNNESDTILEYFLENHGGSETEARTFLAKYMFYGENVFKRLKELSGGERVRLLIAKLVIKQTNFLILDEPTNHLDISTRELLEENLKEYKGTILFVSHDRYFASKIAEREINI
jgi:ABC-type dipeptide/oligopeptide/nickel transport system ATPase subunit